MARIFGTIQSLKCLKSELKNKGVSRFNSVREIKHFLSNFNSEKLKIYQDTSDKLEIEYLEKGIILKQGITNRNKIINLRSEIIDKTISDLETKIKLIDNNKSDKFLKKLYSSVTLYFLRNQYNYYLKNKNKLINLAVIEISKKIANDELFIREYENNKQDLIEKRAKSEIDNLEYTRRVLENAKNLISGAIGENLVVKEIKKLSDDYFLINDFNINFSNPIFYKKYKQRINSIQIDHLLISKAGIFIIETKNWSKLSVNSLSLRSPIEQIERSNFALYIYLSKNITLNAHHWGEQKIPLRNVLVMINNKPKEEFKYVRVKLLRELNDYIKYFPPVFSEKQFDKIINNLT